jgi:tellurite resistance protein TehA-like permease
MYSVTKKILSFAGCAALIASSSAAVAAAPAPQAAAPNAWMMLSMLSPSGSVALGGAQAAAQPQTDVPPPPPSAEPATGPAFPPLPVIAIWLAVIGVDIWILTRNHHHVRIPNSPA